MPIDAAAGLQRALSLICGALGMLASGTQYMFSAFSPALREALRISPPAVAGAAAAIQVGLYGGGLLPGLLFDRLRLWAMDKKEKTNHEVVLLLPDKSSDGGRVRAPSIATALGGALLLSSGYGAVWLLATGVRGNDAGDESLLSHEWVRVAVVCAAFACVGLGSASTYTSALATNVHNVPVRHTGLAVGFSYRSLASRQQFSLQYTRRRSRASLT
jgi:hypothetical protein